MQWWCPSGGVHTKTGILTFMGFKHDNSFFSVLLGFHFLSSLGLTWFWMRVRDWLSYLDSGLVVVIYRTAMTILSSS